MQPMSRVKQLALLIVLLPTPLLAQFSSSPGMLEQQLKNEDPAALAEDARRFGDAARGAILFHQPFMTCVQCHTAGASGKPLGPDLAGSGERLAGVHVVESILDPSKSIKRGYESVVIATDDGNAITGLLVEDLQDALVIRDVAADGKQRKITKSQIEQMRTNTLSIMPAGLTNQLASRQQFLDLIRYLIEITEQGRQRALQLKPSPSLYAARPLPGYEKEIDHAGMIADLDNECFERGKAIYSRLCINCHGTKDQPGSLPTSLRFASGKFKNGADPYSMYQTLTKGFGMMVPQTWMVPQQKYDVIHYVREHYLKTWNPTQFVNVTPDYLARLPQGDSRGPAPSNIEPWSNMDYGPSLINSYEVGKDGSNFAYKGIAVRLDPGPGGVAQGRYFMVFDHDTLRMAAGWSGEGFIDWNGIHFNGRHGVHPRVVGDVHLANPTGPGWANPADAAFSDSRVVGRDGRRYGPLPRSWAHYKGMYRYQDRTIISYTVGDTAVLEMPGMVMRDDFPVFTRTFNIGPRTKRMVLQVADHPDDSAELLTDTAESLAVVGSHANTIEPEETVPIDGRFAFTGAASVLVSPADDFDMTSEDYTIYARIRTEEDGSILSKTTATGPWVEDGKTLFISDGHLTFDIGWVGAAGSRRAVDDGRWHEVAMTWNADGGRLRFYIDGRPDRQARLKPRERQEGQVVKLGFTSDDFPTEDNHFQGDISEIRFYQRELSAEQVRGISTSDRSDPSLVARWMPQSVEGERILDQSGNGHHGQAITGEILAPIDHLIAAAVDSPIDGMAWRRDAEGRLRLQIPAGTEPLKFTLSMARVGDATSAELVRIAHDEAISGNDLAPLVHGGPPLYPDTLPTKPSISTEDGPFAVDVLRHPVDNPWFCRMRLSGFDFFPDGDRAAVCAWDGSVWLVTGLGHAEENLVWRRIAHGLFQPLGVKIVDGKIYVACRDQIAILHDLNGDGEADFYESFNNDHQVTEHFHEFAMGLQTDEEGNFYYAKSARHALRALVPHHGTLLRVSKDGTQTEILARGFRAANGVCINPDGSFIVTDQEGHWNPKNRINWVREGGFYGNMWGYHDISDSSDDVMEQPLCWITNAFDRSPAELLWVRSAAWGPLNGALLNLSYGYGKVYVVPHENQNGQMQGGMCQLPITQFPTGTMRGRFHPTDGQLYLCGMFAWAGTQHQDGGFYRIRYTGKPVHLPIGLNARRNGMSITFSGEIDPDSATPDQFAVKVWSLKRTANYGSDHYNERPLKVTNVHVADDLRVVHLEIPDVAPTWCMEIRYSLRGSGGEPVIGTIHNTIHQLGE